MNIKIQLYKAISKSMVGRYSVYAANIVSMMILARIFSPETFGLVASITVLFVFFQMLSEAGLGPAIINIEKLDQVDRNGIFSLTVFFGLLMGGVFFLATPLIADFYGIDDTAKVVPYVAGSLIFFAMSILPTAFLLREQAFLRIAVVGFASETVSTVSTITLFLIVEPLHALASKPLFSAATTFLCVYYFSKKTEFGRPFLGVKFSAIRPLLSFSAYQFSFNFLNYFTRNLDNILVAKYMGALSLGIYDKAYQLMRYPLLLLTFAMTPAIQPVIRKHAQDLETVEAIHRDFTFKLSLAGSAVGLGVFLLSEQIVFVLLGKNWLDVVPVIKILALAIPIQIVLSTSGSFFQALNRADLLFMCGLFSSAVTVCAITWGISQNSLIALSWAIVIAFHINFFQAYYTLYSKIFKNGFNSFLVKAAPAGLTTLTMAASLFI